MFKEKYEEGNIIDAHEMNYSDLEGITDPDKDILDDETDSSDMEEEVDEDSESEINSDDSDDSPESDPEEEPDNKPEEDMRTELEKRDEIIANQKKMIDKQSHEVGLSRAFRNNLPGFTDEEKELIQDAELDGGFMAAQEKFDEIVRKKEEDAIKDYQRNLQENEEKLNILCPDLQDYEAEMRQILKEEGIPDQNIDNAFTYKGSSDPYQMAQIYKRAKERKTFSSSASELEELRVKNQELEEALRTGNAEYLRKLEKKANAPSTIRSKTVGGKKPIQQTDLNPHEMSYDELNNGLN